MIWITEFIKGICLSLFILGSVFVFIFGKPKSGIKLDYFISCIILLIIMWRVSI